MKSYQRDFCDRMKELIDADETIRAAGNVAAFVEDRAALANLRNLLTGVRDLERLIAKVDSGRANPRDLKGLATSLRPVPEIREQSTAVDCSRQRSTAVECRNLGHWRPA